ncbi:MAG: ribonuclease E [Hyphococcus sp.]|nr:MAG: ribonuclease E [Marinicaulis sp.]
MLIDAAHPEEVRVALLDNGKVEDFDFESATRKPLRGNIYLARVTRVEPSLQAAFVEYGGNRHGFLAFSEIHPDYYQIPVSDRQALQAAELEVAELAEQLELSQRGDDDHDDDRDLDGDSNSDDGESDDNDSGRSASESGRDEGEKKPRASRRRKRKTASRAVEEDSDENSGDNEDDSTKLEAVSNGDSGDESQTASDDGEGDSDSDSDDIRDPLNEINGDPTEEEEEEEEDGEEDEDAPVSKAKTASNDADDDDTSVEASADEAANNDHGDDHDDDGGEGETQDIEASDADEEQSNDETDSESEGEDEEEGLAPSRKRPSGKEREILFERYKDAKRRRSNLLRNYKIQEVIKRRQILLIQVVKEERGNKGAALTTYMSLAGRYCVLMPNTARGGGISRKIPHSTDRKRLRRVVDSLDVPQGMGLIIRTAGAKRTKVEIKRDYDYLLRLWENIRSLTLKSIAPCLIYEEASLIKRAIRDLYDKDIGEVQVEGENGYREAKDFMKMLMPSHAKFVQPYKGTAPIFLKHGVEAQLDGMYQPSVRLKSGGYIVIHQTEALIAIDVNSGRSTRERNIEQTALKTNIEAAHEAARQFRLRDLAGLIVLDFIDMEEMKNNRKVEKALKDAIKHDRARIQLGRISNFGLLEMSRQRRRSGIIDGTTQACPTCSGAGVIRSAEMAALRILRAVEGEAVAGKAGVLSVHASLDVTVYVLNHHRDWLKRIEDSNGVTIQLIPDTERTGDDYTLEKAGVPKERTETATIIQADQTELVEIEDAPDAVEAADESDSEERDDDRKKRRRRRRRKDGPRGQSTEVDAEAQTSASENDAGDGEERPAKEHRAEGEARSDESDEEQSRKRRRRGRRGGRRNRRNREDGADAQSAGQDTGETQPAAETGEATASTEEPQHPAGNGSAKHHDDRHDTNAGHNAQTDESVEKPPLVTTEAEAQSPAAAAAPTDPAEAPQPVVEKPRKKGWWSRGSNA